MYENPTVIKWIIENFDYFASYEEAFKFKTGKLWLVKVVMFDQVPFMLLFSD